MGQMLKKFEEKNSGKFEMFKSHPFWHNYHCMYPDISYDNVGYDKYWTKITWTKLENTFEINYRE